jgi:hypothetical protein
MRIVILFIALSFCTITVAQNFQPSWGEEIKIKKGSVDFTVINADETGVYMLEEKVPSAVFTADPGEKIYNLYKFDKSFNKIYDEDYDKQLDGAKLKNVQFLKKDMYVFASDYSRKTKTTTVSGFKVDRLTGKPLSGMIELGSYDMESRKDNFDFSIIPSQDSTQWLLIADISSETNLVISITPLDANLKRKPSSRIGFSFEPKSFTLENIIETKDNGFVVIGKQYSQVPKGKGKKTVRVFKDYVFAKYDNKGKKLFDFSTITGDRFPLNGKAILTPDGNLSFAAFYSTDRKTTEVNGFLLYKLDLNNGGILHSSFKELTKTSINDPLVEESDDDDETAKKIKKLSPTDDDEGISKHFTIKSILPQPDGSQVILSELSSSETRSGATSEYNSVTKTTVWKTTTYYIFTNSDILAIKTDPSGNVAWMNSLPKYQVETLATMDPRGFNTFNVLYKGVFEETGGMPFYSSFNAMQQNDKIVFLINDHSSNQNVTKHGDRVKKINGFTNSSIYGITLDLNTGLFTRKLIMSNSKEPIIMPGHGYATGNEFYLPASRAHALGKSEIKMGKIVVKP